MKCKHDQIDFIELIDQVHRGVKTYKEVQKIICPTCGTEFSIKSYQQHVKDKIKKL